MLKRTSQTIQYFCIHILTTFNVMAFQKFAIILILFLNFYLISASSKFLKVEFCDSSNISNIVERCDIVNDKFNLVYSVIRPFNHSQVKFCIILSFMWLGWGPPVKISVKFLILKPRWSPPAKTTNFKIHDSNL